MFALAPFRDNARVQSFSFAKPPASHCDRAERETPKTYDIRIRGFSLISELGCNETKPELAIDVHLYQRRMFVVDITAYRRQLGECHIRIVLIFSNQEATPKRGGMVLS